MLLILTGCAKKKYDREMKKINTRDFLFEEFYETV